MVVPLRLAQKKKKSNAAYELRTPYKKWYTTNCVPGLARYHYSTYIYKKKNNKEIFKINKLLNFAVVSLWPHAQLRCVKCNENHLLISSLPAKCALYSGAHTPSHYRGCAIYKKLTDSTKKVKIQHNTSQHVVLYQIHPRPVHHTPA